MSHNPHFDRINLMKWGYVTVGQSDGWTDGGVHNTPITFLKKHGVKVQCVVCCSDLKGVCIFKVNTVLTKLFWIIRQMLHMSVKKIIGRPQVSKSGH